ncbi:LOW QUALITY PROTEIN: aspartate aminotransferase-like [Pecten maximus]|uniref:LOW QUALITY PROTEIN: aspartate aminotransferase-like n=1 Tax=Pecten maximus TaxID=6579 RepID=UPI001458B978|nr:LOW QUALITY PROTEIN: aspartate aminotransferase-like [Pecten maximus]
MSTDSKNVDLVRTDLRGYAPASNLAFNEEIRKLIEQGEKVYHFAFGQSPFPLIEIATEALKENAQQNAYLPVAGLYELRDGISKFHVKYDGIDVDPDNIIVGPGSKELIFLLLQIFNGDVIVISPSWTTYKPQTKLAHHKAYVIETNIENDWKITPALVHQLMKNNTLKKNRLLIFNNPDNPTGTGYNQTELKALSEVFREYNILVLSDEIYGRLHYDQAHVSMTKVYPEGTVLCTGMSKWASAGGWRIGYHIYPPQLSPLMRAVLGAASHTYSCASAPVQFAVSKMLKDLDGCDRYMKHCSRIMGMVGRYSHRELTSVGVKAVEPTAGYYIFPDFGVVKYKLMQRGIETCQQMCDAIFAETCVALMAGGPAFLRPVGELTTRLCFVPFDGRSALEASLAIGLDVALPENFVKEYCTPVYDGIQILKQWVTKQLES